MKEKTGVAIGTEQNKTQLSISHWSLKCLLHLSVLVMKMQMSEAKYYNTW